MITNGYEVTHHQEFLQISSRTDTMQNSKSPVDFNPQHGCHLQDWLLGKMNIWNARWRSAIYNLTFHTRV